MLFSAIFLLKKSKNKL